MVAGGIEDQLRGLGLAYLVGSARHHDLFALALRRERIPKSAECKTPEILAELCGLPGISAIGRQIDGRDAVASVPRDTADRDRRTSLHAGALGMAGDEGVHHHFGDRGVDGRLLRGEPLEERELA